jgi:hypothetical protein
MSDGIKSINITGDAAKTMIGGSKKGRRSTKKNQMGGAEELRGVSPQMEIVKGVESSTSVASTSASSNSSTWLKYPQGAPVPPKINFAPTPSHTPITPDKSAAPFQQGGNKTIKVELKRKTHTKKVHLNPKKTETAKSHISKKHQTKKVRKVTIGVSNLHKRLTRAKKLHKEVKDMPIDKLKEKLVKGGLIKATSKAPPALLQQIAKDAAIVAKKAL